MKEKNKQGGQEVNKKITTEARHQENKNKQTKVERNKQKLKQSQAGRKQTNKARQDKTSK